MRSHTHNIGEKDNGQRHEKKPGIREKIRDTEKPETGKTQRQIGKESETK